MPDTLLDILRSADGRDFLELLMVVNVVHDDRLVQRAGGDAQGTQNLDATRDFISVFQAIKIWEQSALFVNAPVTELKVSTSREPRLLLLHVPNPVLDHRRLNALKMFQPDLTLLVEMEVAVSASYAENSVLLVVGNRRYVPLLFHRYLLSTS